MTLQLTATKRTNKQNDKLRATGSIPAVVYSPDIESESISISASEFEKVYRQSGDSTLITLNVEGEKEPHIVLIQDLQMAPVKDEVLHVDFYKIKEGRELSATISLEFIGIAPGTKVGGILMKQRDTLDVTCLPKDLVNHIEVDLTSLAEIGDNIHISDIAIPEGITVVGDESLLIAAIIAPVEEEEEEEEEMSIDDIEVEEKGKSEEDEDAEESGKEEPKSKEKE